MSELALSYVTRFGILMYDKNCEWLMVRRTSTYNLTASTTTKENTSRVDTPWYGSV